MGTRVWVGDSKWWGRKWRESEAIGRVREWMAHEACKAVPLVQLYIKADVSCGRSSECTSNFRASIVVLSNRYVIVAERSVVATDVIICVSIVFIVYYCCTSDRRATAVSRCLHRTVTHTLQSKRIDLTTKYSETAKANSCNMGNRFTSTTCCERHGVVIYIIIEQNVKVNSKNYNNLFPIFLIQK